MTRILHVISTADTRHGGPVEGTRRFGEAWAKEGHRQDILTLDPIGSNPLPDYPGDVICIGPPATGSLLNRYYYAPALTPWLKANAANYDAVIVSGIWRYQVKGVHAALAKSAVPYFVYIHGMLSPWLSKGFPIKHLAKQLSWLWAEGSFLRDAARVLFTTQDEQDLAHNAFWPYQLKPAIVGYGTGDISGDASEQIAAFHNTFSGLRGKRFLLFVGRLHPIKGCDMLVEAFGAIAARSPDLHLVIVGPDQSGLLPEFMARAEALNVADRIHFPGMVTGDAKIGAFRAADAFVLPSHQENFGVVVAEAMACGTPVLISDKVNIWREVDAEGAGLVEPDTVAGTMRLLERFLALSPEALAAMRTAAREGFVKHFRVEEAARTLMRLIENEVDARRAGTHVKSP